VEVELMDNDTEQVGSNETEAAKTQSEERHEKRESLEGERRIRKDANAAQSTDSPKRKRDSPRRKKDFPSRKTHSVETRADLLEKKRRSATGSRKGRGSVKSRFERECKTGPELQETLP
jgi:hypothetical protein